MSGKTTIAKELARRTNIKYFKNENEKIANYDFSVALKYQATYIQDFLEQTGISAIFDRFWISEMVYSEIFNRPTFASLFNILDEQLYKMNGVIICVEKDVDDFLVDDSNIIKINQYKKIKALYRIYLLSLKTSVLFLNASNYKKNNNEFDIDSQVQLIQKYLNNRSVVNEK